MILSNPNHLFLASKSKRLFVFSEPRDNALFSYISIMILIQGNPVGDKFTFCQIARLTLSDSKILTIHCLSRLFKKSLVTIFLIAGI